MSTTPVHVIDPALIPAGPVLELDAGDVTLVSVAGPDSAPTRTTVDGHPALDLSAAVAFMVDTAGPSTLGSSAAVAGVVCRLGELHRMPWEHTGPLRMLDAHALIFGVEVDWPTLDEDLHAWVLWSDGDDVALVCDGVVVGTGTGATAPETSFTYLQSASGGVLFYAAVWQETVALADAQQLSLDLLAPFAGGAAVEVSAAGGFDVAGSVVLTVDDWYEPPVLPAATPGGAPTPPTVLPDPVVPVSVSDPQVVWRVSEVMDAPTLDDAGFPVGWVPDEVVQEPWASLQILVDDVDVTTWAGVRTPMPSWSRAEPFGCIDATLTFPQVSQFEADPSWCRPGAWVRLRWRLWDGSTSTAWLGVVDKFGRVQDTGEFVVSCRGPVMVSDLQLRAPAFDPQPRDVGPVIADVLNSAVSRRTARCEPRVVGIPTGVAGGWEPRVLGFVQQLLATAVQGGRQWTVRCDERTPQIVLKDTTTVAWTVRAGQRGVVVDMAQDWSQATNVIYGEGVSPQGGRWRNAVYPGWHPDETPTYPGSLSSGFTVGTTDASTSTGTGVSDWQAKAGQPVTGRFSQDDRARTFEIQKAAGITRDGLVGPQTWAATFGTGSHVGTLDAFFLPLAWSDTVVPRRYDADGTDAGPNPTYDESVLRVEDKVDFGQGVSKADGKRAAREMLTRTIEPGWSGQVTLTLDPAEGSRYQIREGDNVRVRGFRGVSSIVVHVAHVAYDEERVVLTVDTNARDYPTLEAIRDRDRNATDPAKAVIRRLQRGTVTEARATFDAESPAGHLPRHALFGGLWSVVPVPFGRYGQIVRTELTTSGPAVPFVTAVFNEPVTAAQLLTLVGNPLTAEDNPWDENADALAAAGLVMAWGWREQPCGYYPRSYATPAGSGDAPATGRFVDDASWEYATERSPWLWVATIASSGCWVQGRFWPGAD